MRLLLATFLFALSYAQTEQIWTSGISEALNKACTFHNGHVVESGWTGKGFGDEECNSCACNNGILMCTLLICTTTTASSPARSGCALTGSESVEDGWSGKDTGSNSCNNCMCSNGDLMCTRMACTIELDQGSTAPSTQELRDATSKPSATAYSSQSFPKFAFPDRTPRRTEPDWSELPPIPAWSELPMAPHQRIADELYPNIRPAGYQPGPDFTQMDKTTCGGNTDGACHGKNMQLCFADPCCNFLSGKCESVAKVVPVGLGLECGDLLMLQCKTNSVCLWSEIEMECIELKEIECQDIKSQEHCFDAQMCSWVLDNGVPVCLETKEVEIQHLVPNVPPHRGLLTPSGRGRLSKTYQHTINSNDRSAEEGNAIWLFATITFVGLILGCVMSTFIAKLIYGDKKLQIKDLSENFCVARKL